MVCHALCISPLAASQATDPAALSTELQRRVNALHPLQSAQLPVPEPVRSRSAASAPSGGRELAFGAPVRRREAHTIDRTVYSNAATLHSLASGSSPPHGPVAGRLICSSNASSLAALPQPLPAERTVPGGISSASEQPAPPPASAGTLLSQDGAKRAAEAAAQALAAAELLGIDVQPCPVRLLLKYAYLVAQVCGSCAHTCV